MDDEIRALYTAFIDVMFMLLAAFWLMINPEVTKALTSQPMPIMSAYMVWTEGRDIDMDIYVKAPDGHTVWFKKKADGGVVWLDRDDIGTTAGNGVLNMEVVKWGDMLPGHYLISAHEYADREAPVHHDGDSVTVEVFDKTGSKICGKTVMLPGEKQEIPLFDIEVRNGFPYCGPSNVKLRRELERESEIG